MVCANVEDHRKPFLSALFAIISLSTATFVYLAVDGSHSLHSCHNISLVDGSSHSANISTTTTTTHAPPSIASSSDESNRADQLAEVGVAPATTAAVPKFKIVNVDKYLHANTGGVVICALLTVTAIVIVLSVYCRSPNILRVTFAIFFVLVLTLMYPIVVFGQALSIGHDCENVGVRVVPASIGLLIVGLSTALFFSDTLDKIRSGDEPSAMSRLIGG